MSENKQYITQIRDNGSIMISEDVITAIVAHAVTDVDGVVSLNVKPGADIAEFIGKKNWGKGVKVVISDEDELYIDCNISIGYGQNVVTTAKKVQDAITNAIENMTGIVIRSVNVNVCGIVR